MTECSTSESLSDIFWVHKATSAVQKKPFLGSKSCFMASYRRNVPLHSSTCPGTSFSP